MQLPAGFPHTRHEQHLVALPAELRSPTETQTVLAVLRRAMVFCDLILYISRAHLREQGYSDEEITAASQRRS